MHLQPIYRDHVFVKRGSRDVGADIFHRGLCLPSDNKMIPQEQEQIIEIVRSCFE
jgi:dTDP-4-amino-4,6-dideoxygalactose transaminase